MSKFSDHENEAVGFESKWRETRSYETIDTQTQPIISNDQETESVLCSKKEIQTTPISSLGLAEISEEEEQSLSVFLSNISSSVMKELDKNELSNAMARFASLDCEDVENVQCEKIQNFDVPKISNSSKVKVSCVSWNCAGSLIAVAFCSQGHSNWCNHEGNIHFYNTEKSVPSHCIKTKSCVTSVSMHPYELSLVAVGIFSGEVSTYNLHIEDIDCLVKSNWSHSSQITLISWEYTVSTSNRPVLIASSLDGTITMYNVMIQTNTMALVKRFILSDSQLPVYPGVLCYSFSSILNGTFVAAVEGGQIYSCSTATASLEPTEDQDHVYNPIVCAFDKHPSNVNCLSFSKHSSAKENIFVSSSLEEIRVYLLNSTTPLHTIFSEKSCLGITWSITQPQILLYWGADSNIIVYNVGKRQQLTTLSLNKPDQVITSVAFNSKIPNLIATGNNLGETRIWQVPKYFRL